MRPRDIIRHNREQDHGVRRHVESRCWRRRGSHDVEGPVAESPVHQAGTSCATRPTEQNGQEHRCHVAGHRRGNRRHTVILGRETGTRYETCRRYGGIRSTSRLRFARKQASSFRPQAASSRQLAQAQAQAQARNRTASRKHPTAADSRQLTACSLQLMARGSAAR
jgi:hypothetical protein